MVLEKCPHMTARCPHYQAGCNDQASKGCHHIKRTVASMVTAASLLKFGVQRFSPAMQEYLQQTGAFLSEMGMSLLEERERDV